MMMTLMIGLFVLGGVSAFGQLAENPSDKKIVLESKDLYEHGYNKDNATSDTPAEGEARDFVMVGSIMPYFIMPDRNYNPAYFNQQNYNATNLTRSWFDWVIPATATSHTFMTPNDVARPPNGALNQVATATSPWVSVTWGNTPGDTELTVSEFPEMLFTGSACVNTGLVRIPVSIIARPTMTFRQVGAPLAYADFACVEKVGDGVGDNDDPFEINFPVTGFTQSSDLQVAYSLQIYEFDGTTPHSVLSDPIEGIFKTADMTTGTTTTPHGPNIVQTPVTALKYDATVYGVYALTISTITDHISEKCGITGITAPTAGGANVFRFTVIPQPKAGRTYHVPNNF